MKKIIVKLGSVFAALALMITTANVNSTCMCFVHQSEMPEEAYKLRKLRDE